MMGEVILKEKNENSGIRSKSCMESESVRVRTHSSPCGVVGTQCRANSGRLALTQVMFRAFNTPVVARGAALSSNALPL